MIKNCLLFHLKSSFCSQDIYCFIMNFWSCRKNGFIRKIRLISKFMTSQPGQQKKAIHILPNISRSKSNQTIKLGQLIEYSRRNIFLQKLCRKWGWETSSRPLLIFKKCLIRGKSKWSAASFQYISIALNLGYNKNKLYKTLDYWSRDMCNFNFPEKGLGLVSPPHFVYKISREMFLTLYSINWPNSIVWLPLPLEIFGNMCITIVC